jgi:hypothetical protein
MTPLADAAARIARAALPLEDVPYGPWKGAVESRSPDQIGREYANGHASHDMLFLPRTGTWKRRGGQTILFDTTTVGVGYGDVYADTYAGL